MSCSFHGDDWLPVGGFALAVLVSGWLLLSGAANSPVEAQPRTMPSQVETPLRFIRTNLACIYVMGTVQQGISIAAVAHGGEACN